MYAPLSPTRKQLEQFLGPNHLLISLFEQLFNKNSMLAPEYQDGQLIGIENGVFVGIDDVAAGFVLLSGGVGDLPAFGKVNLQVHVTGTLPVSNGGTGITGGTSGGVLGFTAAGTIASSSALAQHAIVVGGGAGATPSALGSLGTANKVLHGNSSGAPTWSAVDLSADVTGNLNVSHLNGGAGASATTYWRGDGSWADPLSGGINATIATAPLTGGGTPGSMTFTNGLLTAQVQAT